MGEILTSEPLSYVSVKSDLKMLIYLVIAAASTVFAWWFLPLQTTLFYFIINKCNNLSRTAWIVCCLEICSTRQLSSLLLNFASLQFSRHGCKHSQLLCQNMTWMTSSSVPYKVLVPLWDLTSTVLTMHISVSILISQNSDRLSKWPRKLFFHHSGGSVAHSWKHLLYHFWLLGSRVHGSHSDDCLLHQPSMLVTFSLLWQTAERSSFRRGRCV